MSDRRKVEEEVVEVAGCLRKILKSGSKSRPAPGWGSAHVIEIEVVAELFTSSAGW